MRPLELTVEGFRSYGAEQSFSFEDRSLFGIVGPTGSGKSSILDALIYALYGKTPRLQKETKKLVNSASNEARIKLLFEVGGEAWEVFRIIRAGAGASQVKLVRHEDGHLDSTGEGNVTQRIVEIVGLDYDAFCSSVTLPQGEFDRFLKASTGERIKILKRVFRLERVDRMRETAKQRRDSAQVDLATLQGQITALPNDPSALVEQVSGRLDEARARVDQLSSAVEQISVVNKELGDAESALELAKAAAHEVEGILRKLPEPEALQDLVESEQQAKLNLEAAEKAIKQTNGSVQECEKTLTAAQQELGGPSLAEAVDLLKQRSQLQERAAEVEKEAGDLRGLLLTLQKGRDRSVAESAAAQEELDRAESVLSELRDAHSALHLRAKLAPGEPCPVCEQSVARVPTIDRAGDLELAQAAVGAGKKRVAESSAARSEAEKALATRVGFLQTTETELARITRQSQELEARLTELLGSGAPEKEIARRQEQIQKCERALSETRGKLKGLEQAAEAPNRAFRELTSRRTKLAGELIAACTVLRVEAPSVEDDAAALAGACKTARESAVLRLERERDSEKKSSARVRAAKQRKIKIMESHGLIEHEDVVQTLATANQSVGVLTGQLESARAAVKSLERLEKKSKSKQKDLDLYKRLVNDFADSRFPEYLLNEQTRRLSSLGSEKLYQLTGRYRFDDDGSFQIVDSVAGVQRSPDTLSGGETFLASLALALALAEAVAQGGGELSCFFLDEGFGTLDAASLDLALDGIENLAGPERIIGLISHVPTLQARLDDLIVLDKAADGSTLVVQSEGPIGYGAATI